jgi:hypothetical protein
MTTPMYLPEMVSYAIAVIAKLPVMLWDTNTNVDWKNTATVLNCVSARWQDEEDRPPISIFWASPCFAGDSESYNPLWKNCHSFGHIVGGIWQDEDGTRRSPHFT